MWLRQVARVIPSSTSISLLDRPRAMSSSTSRCRGVRSSTLLAQELQEAPADAVRTVHEGQSLLSPQVLARLVARMPRTAPAGAPGIARADDVEALTPRQREVLLLIARGLSNSEIEVELGITRATCRSHITALLARLGARDRAQLVIAAYEAGLISPR